MFRHVGSRRWKCPEIDYHKQIEEEASGQCSPYVDHVIITCCSITKYQGLFLVYEV